LGIRQSLTELKGVNLVPGLGAVLSPVAALLPFLSLGGAHDADCAGPLAQARSAGAPVAAGHGQG
jgi:hypothetical protein